MSIVACAQALTVRYGSRTALYEVNLELHVGELVSVVGPNGAGKSTLLKALAGLISASSGRVSRVSAEAHKLAYLAQSERLPGDFSARELVELGRIAHSGLWRRLSAKDELAVEGAMRRTSTLELADRELGSLSGGEQQRVALARALAQEPRLLLLDEPTSHLDLRHQAELLAVVRREAEGGTCVVVVLHDLRLAAQTDRCVVLAGGVLRAQGRPDAVLNAESLSQIYETPIEVVRTHAGELAVIPTRFAPTNSGATT